MQNALETLQKQDICKRMVLRLLKYFRNTFEHTFETHCQCHTQGPQLSIPNGSTQFYGRFISKD